MDLDTIHLERHGRSASFNGTWYRGEHTHFIPCKEDLRRATAFDEFVMTGLAPEAPFIDRATTITAFGSCFAANISAHLAAQGYAVLGKTLDLNAHIVRFGEGIVNTFAIRQQFEWALTGKEFPQSLWITESKDVASKDAAIRDATRDIIAASRVFIVTLGLSEIWYDKPTGEAFWRAVPAHLFDPARHGFRSTTVDENRENIAVTLDLIRAARPDASVILTLSPIPLMATFRPVSCVTANAVSKAVLRVAIDQIMSEGRADVHYYPSYEMGHGRLVRSARGRQPPSQASCHRRRHGLLPTTLLPSVNRTIASRRGSDTTTSSRSTRAPGPDRASRRRAGAG